MSAKEPEVEELPEPVAGEPLRLAFFSPVPPVTSGVGDYLVDLLPTLPEAWTIDIFVDDGVVPTQDPVAGRGRCFPHREWRRRQDDSAYDLNVYQIGNNRVHAYALPYVLAQPGLLVLHDAVVHPARALHAIESGNIAAYRETAESCRPDVGRALGHMIAGGLASPELFFRFPLSEDLVRASHITGVHGEALAGWLQALMSEARICALTHWRSVPESSPEQVASWRRQLLGEGDGVILGCFGNIDAARRLDRVLSAVAGLREAVHIELVVAGAVDPGLKLAERAVAAGIADRVHWMGRVSEENFGTLIRSVDFAVNLRYPPARASSGVLHQLLVAGTPAVISDLAHWTDYPDDAVARVPTGPDDVELAALRDAIERLATQPELRNRAADAARRWAAEHIGPERAGRSYARAVALALEGTR